VTIPLAAHHPIAQATFTAVKRLTAPHKQTKPHLQKNRRAQIIWRSGRSYLADTKKSVTPSSPCTGSRYEIARSTAEWNGGITAGGKAMRPVKTCD